MEEEGRKIQAPLAKRKKVFQHKLPDGNMRGHKRLAALWPVVSARVRCHRRHGQARATRAGTGRHGQTRAGTGRHGQAQAGAGTETASCSLLCFCPNSLSILHKNSAAFLALPTHSCSIITSLANTRASMRKLVSLCKLDKWLRVQATIGPHIPCGGGARMEVIVKAGHHQRTVPSKLCMCWVHRCRFGRSQWEKDATLPHRVWTAPKTHQVNPDDSSPLV